LISDSGIKQLESLPLLDRLEVQGCNKFSDIGLASAANLLPNLSYIDIGDTQVTRSGLNSLSGFNRLRQIGLSDLNITDDDVDRLPRGFRWLDLTACPLITDRSLQILARRRSVVSVNVTACPGVTKYGVANFKSQKPGATICWPPLGDEINEPGAEEFYKAQPL
jgi:hypothetical protein